MQVIFEVRDNLNDTSTTSDVEVMAVAAAAKAQEYMKQCNSACEAPQLTAEEQSVSGEDEQALETEAETDENGNILDQPLMTLASPNKETDTEEDLFDQKSSLSVPIKAVFNDQQNTEQLEMIRESD